MSVSVTHEEAEVRGVRLRLKRAGDGPPVLLLHGLVGSQLTAGWEALAGAFTLLMPEHPGFGESARPESVRSVQDLAVLYLDLMDQLGVRDAPLVGHSLGGWIAAEMATRARISKLALVGALGFRIEGEPREDIFLRPREEVLDLVYEDRERAPTDGSSFEDARNLNALAHYGWNPYLCDPGLRGRLHRIQSPTLVVWGSRDAVVPPTHAKLLADEIPDCSSAIIDGAGHDATTDQPARLATLVRDFLAANRG